MPSPDWCNNALMACLHLTAHFVRSIQCNPVGFSNDCLAAPLQALVPVETSGVYMHNFCFSELAEVAACNKGFTALLIPLTALVSHTI